MIATKTLLLSPIWGAGVVSLGLIASAVGPGIEIETFPVIKDQVVAKRWRVGDDACYDWTYTKARGATFLRESFVIERDDGIRYPVVMVRPDLGIPTNDSTTAKSGTRRTIPQCAAIPENLRQTQRFTIRGHKQYRPWHGLWTLDQPIIPVAFDGSEPVMPRAD